MKAHEGTMRLTSSSSGAGLAWNLERDPQPAIQSSFSRSVRSPKVPEGRTGAGATAATTAMGATGAAQARRLYSSEPRSKSSAEAEMAGSETHSQGSS